MTNAGSNGKFLGVLDLDLDKGRVKDVRYRLVPVFANLLRPDPDMPAADRPAARAVRGEVCREARDRRELLYRRGNFNGPMDQVICDALRESSTRRSHCRRASAGARQCSPERRSSWKTC